MKNSPNKTTILELKINIYFFTFYDTINISTHINDDCPLFIYWGHFLIYTRRK